jgi:hypothetical protein
MKQLKESSLFVQKTRGVEERRKKLEKELKNLNPG